MAAALQIEAQLDIVREIRLQLVERRGDAHAANELRKTDNAEKTAEHDHEDHARLCHQIPFHGKFLPYAILSDACIASMVLSLQGVPAC